MAFHLRKSAGKQTATFKATEISVDAENPIELEVRHAGLGNDAFMSAIATPADDKESGRERDARLLAKSIVVAWKNVLEDGEVRECTPDNVLRFFLEWIAPKHDGEADVDYHRRVAEFDRLTTFAYSAATFRAPIAPAETLGKG